MLLQTGLISTSKHGPLMTTFHTRSTQVIRDRIDLYRFFLDLN